MPRDNAIGSIRYEVQTKVVMIHREPYNNSNDVNGGKDFRDRITVLAQRTHEVYSSEIAGEIAKVLQ
jgi:hypothetical protein